MTISGFSYERIPVGDVRRGVAHGGAGPPAVLLHGFPQTRLAWRHVAGPPARDHRVIRPDLRGYGGSDKPPGDYSKGRARRSTTRRRSVTSRLLGAAPSEFCGHFLDAWTRDPQAIPPPVRAAYLEAASTSGAIAAVCADYRASATVDAGHDAADRAAGRRLSMPVAALWQRPVAELPFDPAAVWGSWAPDLRTHVLDCGHFLPEERPEEVVAALREPVAA